MNTVGVARIGGWIRLLKDAGKIFSGLTVSALLAALVLGGVFYFYITAENKSEPSKEFLSQEYSQLLSMSDSLYNLKISVEICGESLTYIKVHNKGVPESLWSKKQLSERDRLEIRYWRLRAQYYELALEYNKRMEIVGYRFAYYKNLPAGATEILPKYYTRLGD